MKTVFFIVALLFLAGGLGIFLVNRKLPPPGKIKGISFLITPRTTVPQPK